MGHLPLEVLSVPLLTVFLSLELLVHFSYIVSVSDQNLTTSDFMEASTNGSS